MAPVLVANFPGHEPGRRVQHGGAASSGRHRRRGLSRPDFDRQANGLRLVPRPQIGGDRRAGRREQAGLQPAQPRQPPGGQGARLVGPRRFGAKLRSRSSSRKGPAHDGPGRRIAARETTRRLRNGPVGLVRGTRDWLPADCAALAALERQLLEGFARAGYEPIRTPILEFTELHERKSGAGIVSKLFELASGGPAAICLPPELTASIVSCLRRGTAIALPSPGASAARARSSATRATPARARLREFTQVGVELLGAGGPAADAEVIALADRSLAAAARVEMRPSGSATSGLILEILAHTGLPRGGEVCPRRDDERRPPPRARASRRSTRCSTAWSDGCGPAARPI